MQEENWVLRPAEPSDDEPGSFWVWKLSNKHKRTHTFSGGNTEVRNSKNKASFWSVWVPKVKQAQDLNFTGLRLITWTQFTLFFLLISTLIIRTAAGHIASARKSLFHVMNKGIYRDDWHSLVQWALTEMNSLMVITGLRSARQSWSVLMDY